MELPVWSKLRNEDYLMRVLNKRYWPHHIKIADEIGEKEKWCYQNFKSSQWRNVGNYFAFKSEQDAMLFTLRWA